MTRLFAGMTGVYELRNLKTGRVYVGAAASVVGRLYAHNEALQAGTHHNAALQADYREHGPDAFWTGLVERCARADLRAREQARLEHHEREGTALYNDRCAVERPRYGPDVDGRSVRAPAPGKGKRARLVNRIDVSQPDGTPK